MDQAVRILELEADLAAKEKELEVERSMSVRFWRHLKRLAAKGYAHKLTKRSVATCDGIMEVVEQYYPGRAVEALTVRFLHRGGAMARRIANGYEEIEPQRAREIISDFQDPTVRLWISEGIEELEANAVEKKRKPRQEKGNLAAEAHADSPHALIPENAHVSRLTAHASDKEPPSCESPIYQAGYDAGFEVGKEAGRRGVPTPKREHFLRAVPDWRILHILNGKATREALSKASSMTTQPAARRVCAALVMQYRWNFDADEAMSLAGIDPTQHGLFGAFVDEAKMRLGLPNLPARIRAGEHIASEWIEAMEAMLASWRTA